MNAHNEQQWPEYLMLRDTGLYDDAGGLGQHIFTTAGAGYVKQKYVRADLAAQPSPVVKQNLTTQHAAAQEAVVWQWRNLRAETGWKDCTRAVYDVFRQNGLNYEVRKLYAAPVTAAPAGSLSPLARIADAFGVTGTWDQIADAVIARSTPAAPGIDTGNLISSMQSMRDRMMAALVPKFGEAFDGDFDTMLEAINVLKRIDASPKGKHPVGTPMMPDGQFYDGCWERLPRGMQQYGRMLTQSWRTADSTELKRALEAGVLAMMDSPKGGSEAVSVKRNCAPPSWMFPDDGGVTTGWRAQASAWLEEQAVEQERTNAAYPAHVAAYPSWVDRVHWLRSLADKVVQAQAGDAEVQP